MTPDEIEHRILRYDTHMHAAETLDSAATSHEDRADRFERIGQHTLAMQERGLARNDRQRAENARHRASDWR